MIKLNHTAHRAYLMALFGTLIIPITAAVPEKNPLRQAIAAEDFAAATELIKKGAEIDDEIAKVLKNDDSNHWQAYLKTLLGYRATLAKQGLVDPSLNIRFDYDEYLNVDLLELLLTYPQTTLSKEALNSAFHATVHPAYSRWHSKDKKTPQEIESIMGRKIRTIKLLLNHGADVNEQGAHDGYYEHSPLHTALGTNKDICADYWYTSEQVVQILLEAGANAHEIEAHSQYTLLHGAARGGDRNAGTVRLFVKAGIPINTQAYNAVYSNFDGTALHLAAHNGSCEVVKELLMHGADINIRNGAGNTPLHEAISYSKNRYGIVDLLIKHGADMNVRNSVGNTPLHRAISDAEYTIAALLIDQGANVSIKNNNGLTAWDLFSGDKKGKCGQELVPRFIGRGIDVNVISTDGSTALHRAAANGSYVTVQELLTYGAKVNVQDSNGDTPLQRAVRLLPYPRHKITDNAQYPRIREVVKLLREHGADITLKNHKGEAPADILSEHERIETVDKHYGQSVYGLCDQDTKLNQALTKAYWDNYFFGLKSFFKKPSQEKIAELQTDSAYIRSVAQIVATCITEAKQNLNNLESEKTFFGDGNNPGLAIVANILLFPWILMSETSNARRKDAVREALRTMQRTKRELETRADEIQSRVAFLD